MPGGFMPQHRTPVGVAGRSFALGVAPLAAGLFARRLGVRPLK